MWRRTLVAAVAVLALVGCGRGDDEGDDMHRTAAPGGAPTTVEVPPPAAQATTSPPPPPAPPVTDVAPAPPTTLQVIEIPVRIERRVDDELTADFAEAVAATLTDGRGWTRAGYTFAFRDDAPFTIVLAEGPEVDDLCAPYDTGGLYSCQLGPLVALNADRWRDATPEWPGDLGTYRQMLVNHEVGHLLGQHHPTGGCTTPGAPAPVMIQQSTDLAGCLANPWPLHWEIACAAARLEPLAPPHEEAASPVCGPDGPHREG